MLVAPSILHHGDVVLVQYHTQVVALIALA